ncbi:xanthine and Co dehydrogenase maturation factor [Halococcus morrhuae DSM 1307]|uniref:Xanthine and Co dehydrogenase maturation factor n=1 Tax=Halococcus morrhuae DSM 1307 TaxID=931277 RepID=M0MT18_HALMO|nr:XdhC/CoxI family protein [Halococcus morrhuae]EMA47595.1 xanthine and Co dehydrogenase maturation factor [Halococcus morrhuae DSM 1307]
MTDTNWEMAEADVLAAIGDTLDRDSDAVLATIIDVEGSAYRRPGAKMLIEDDGGAGSLTAGCLEDEVRGLANDVLDAGQPRIETYDLMGDEDVWGLGMGCNGIITVLLEPLAASHRPAVERVEHGTDCATLTVVGGDRPIGERAIYDPDDGFAGDLPTWLVADLADRTAALFDAGRSETLSIDTDEGSVELFVDTIEAPPELVVLGSGPDVTPVVELATRVGFRVAVVAFRGALSEADFPAADTVHTTSPPKLRKTVDLDADTHVVVMTHNFIDDRLALGELLETPVPYIGLMGPRDRFEEMRDELAAESVSITDTDTDRIYTPIGLDLGGDAPSTIAYSIVAELLAVANDRTPHHLAERAGPIHERRAVEPTDRS